MPPVSPKTSPREKRHSQGQMDLRVCLLLELSALVNGIPPKLWLALSEPAARLFQERQMRPGLVCRVLRGG